MSNESRKARLLSTGAIISVYKLKSGGWCNWDNCKTVYSENEIQLL